MYAVIIVTLSTFSIVWEIYSAKTNENNLRRLVKTDFIVSVLRSEKICSMDSKDLVVGDIVLLSPKFAANTKNTAG